MTETLSKTNNPRLITVGISGKNALFTQRGRRPSDGFVRVNGKTIRGFVPAYGRGGKVFYAYLSGKNADVARQQEAA